MLRLGAAERTALLMLVDRAELTLRERYLSGWLRAMNDPEGTRQRAILMGECFAVIRGELTNADQ